MKHVWKGIVFAGFGTIYAGLWIAEKIEEWFFDNPDDPIHLWSNADLDHLAAERAREAGSNGNTTKSRSPGP